MGVDSGKSKEVSVQAGSLEEQLRLFQEKYRILFENVSSGVAVYRACNNGEDFIIADFNPAAEHIEKIKKEEVIGKSVLEVFPGVKAFGLFDVFQRVWRTGTPEHHPVSTYRDDRIAGWRENYVFRLPSGEVVAVYDDVTEHKHSELAVRMSEQCFKAIANYTYGWELWIGPAGRALWTNPASKRISGYTPQEILAMEDFPAPLIYEKDRRRLTRAFESALRGGSGNNVQFRLQRKDGRVIWAEMSWQPIYDENHASLGHRESIRDITVRKEVEEALARAEHEKEAILDSLAEQVVYQDTQMVVLWANAAACKWAGMSREQVIGRPCYQIWGKSDKPCDGCPVVKAMETGRPHETERTGPDGTVWFVQGSPVKSREGNIIGGVEIALDITARKHTEEALRMSDEKYRKLVDKLKRD